MKEGAYGRLFSLSHLTFWKVFEKLKGLVNNGLLPLLSLLLFPCPRDGESE